MTTKTVILSSSNLILNEGSYEADKIDFERVKTLVGDNPIESTIANRDMSTYLADVLGREIWPSNRTVSHAVGQIMISCRPKARRRRGELLTKEELASSGVEYMLIERVD